MANLACKTLAEHFAGDRAHGLLDVKFYVHNQRHATETTLCGEALEIFDAIENGAVEDYAFNDRHL